MPNESLVKSHVRKALKERDWYFWMPSGSAYGTSGVSDFCALRDGVFMAIETKFHPNKPTEQQKKFLRVVRSNQCLSFVVSDKTFDIFESFLDAFDRARDAQMRNKDASDEDKALLVSATKILIEPFMEQKQ